MNSRAAKQNTKQDQRNQRNSAERYEEESKRENTDQGRSANAEEHREQEPSHRSSQNRRFGLNPRRLVIATMQGRERDHTLVSADAIALILAQTGVKLL